MKDPILTLPGVAVLLKIAEKTVYTMAQKDQIPAFIDAWIDAQKAAAKANIGKGVADV